MATSRKRGTDTADLLIKMGADLVEIRRIIEATIESVKLINEKLEAQQQSAVKPVIDEQACRADWLSFINDAQQLGAARSASVQSLSDVMITADIAVNQQPIQQPPAPQIQESPAMPPVIMQVTPGSLFTETLADRVKDKRRKTANPKQSRRR